MQLQAFIRAIDGARTRGLDLGKVARYQLRHYRIYYCLHKTFIVYTILRNLSTVSVKFYHDFVTNSFYPAKRVMGIEPTYPAWKAGVLPLNYTRKSFVCKLFSTVQWCIERYPHNAQSRNRTSDTRIFSPLLYRLSYLGA